MQGGQAKSNCGKIVELREIAKLRKIADLNPLPPAFRQPLATTCDGPQTSATHIRRVTGLCFKALNTERAWGVFIGSQEDATKRDESQAQRCCPSNFGRVLEGATESCANSRAAIRQVKEKNAQKTVHLPNPQMDG
jgi:hypothetical protein